MRQQPFGRFRCGTGIPVRCTSRSPHRVAISACRGADLRLPGEEPRDHQRVQFAGTGRSERGTEQERSAGKRWRASSHIASMRAMANASGVRPSPRNPAPDSSTSTAATREPGMHLRADRTRMHCAHPVGRPQRRQSRHSNRRSPVTPTPARHYAQERNQPVRRQAPDRRGRPGAGEMFTTSSTSSPASFTASQPRIDQDE